MDISLLTDSFNGKILQSVITKNEVSFSKPISIVNDQTTPEESCIYVVDNERLDRFVALFPKYVSSTIFVSSHNPIRWSASSFPSINVVVIKMSVTDILNRLIRTIQKFNNFRLECSSSILEHKSAERLIRLCANELQGCVALLSTDMRILLVSGEDQLLADKKINKDEMNRLILPQNVNIKKIMTQKEIVTEIQYNTTQSLFIIPIQLSADNYRFLISLEQKKPKKARTIACLKMGSSFLKLLYTRVDSFSIKGPNKYAQILDYCATTHHPSSPEIISRLKNLEKPVHRFFASLLIHRRTEKIKLTNDDVFRLICNEFPD